MLGFKLIHVIKKWLWCTEKLTTHNYPRKEDNKFDFSGIKVQFNGTFCTHYTRYHDEVKTRKLKISDITTDKIASTLSREKKTWYMK